MVNYWKIKAAHLECVARRMEADGIRDRIFREEGLDPTQQYHLDDRTETITQALPPAPPADVTPS